MWLSKMVAEGGREKENGTKLGEVTIGGEGAAVLTDCEARDVLVASPGGYYWLPGVGENVVVLRCESGERIIQAATAAGCDVALACGEIYIKSKAASLFLRNDGSIEIYGKVDISGAVNIGGNVVVDGSITATGSITGM